MKRAIIIVLDSVGIGELPDAYKYNDEGSNTLGNIAKAVKNLKLPNMRNIGLWNIDGIYGGEPLDSPLGCFGKMAERSRERYNYGHWELAGVIMDRPFQYILKDFPKK